MMRILQKTIFDISYNQHNPSKYHIVTRCDVKPKHPLLMQGMFCFLCCYLVKGPIRGLH